MKQSIFEASEALQKWEGMILKKTWLFHQLSCNSEEATIWTSLNPTLTGRLLTSNRSNIILSLHIVSTIKIRYITEKIKWSQIWSKNSEMSPQGGITTSIIIQKIIFILVQKGSREALSLHNHHHPSQSCAMGSNILLSRMYLISYNVFTAFRLDARLPGERSRHWSLKSFL